LQKVLPEGVLRSFIEFGEVLCRLEATVLDDELNVRKIFIPWLGMIPLVKNHSRVRRGAEACGGRKEREEYDYVILAKLGRDSHPRQLVRVET